MSIKNIFGWIFLAAGVAGACWVFFNIFLLFTTDSKPAIVQQIATIAGGQLLVTSPSGNITLPGKAFVIVGYMLAGLLMLIAAYISVAFIKIGLRLSSPDVAKQLRKLLHQRAKMNE